MVNNSYYYGGNNVNVTITGSNTTVYAKWNNGLENKTILTGPYLFLSGYDALPNDLGTYYLYIRTFDIFDIESIYVFKFILDQEAPIIDSSIYNYNDTIFLPSTIFTFVLSDNYTLNSDLIVKYSINNGVNNTLFTPFQLPLSSFYDGNYNLTLYVFDIANNYATSTIFFSIDTIDPVLDITIEGLATVLLDGSKYVPANTTVIVLVDDEDPNTLITYSWGGVTYHSFTESFTLDYPDGTATLYINASDSVGHHVLETFELTIDSLAPILLFPANYSTINKEANLVFVVEDISVNTIKEVKYAWDIFIPFSIGILPDTNGEVNINLYYLYTERVEPAIIYFNVTDIVGNKQSYQFSFVIDLTPPIPALYVIDSETGNKTDISVVDYIRGDVSLWYNSSENTDLREFLYYWDGDFQHKYQLLDPWEIQNIPLNDGPHNLTIILKDNTTYGDYSNIYIETYNLTVDNLKIDFIEPVDFENNYYHQMEYKDVFTFILNITDALDNSSIEDLQYSAIKDMNLNLDVSIVSLDNFTYQITITATNVTNGEYSNIECQFWQFENNKEIINVFLLIDKKEGNLVILDSSDSVIYGEDIFIVCKLLDDVNISAQDIRNVMIDGQTITNFWILDAVNMIFQINYTTSAYFDSQGNYSLNMYVDSTFFFDNLTSNNLVEVEIQPIPIILFVNVSSLEIVEGSQVAIYALLTYQNGAPVPIETVIFYIYIFFKNETNGVQALVLNYDYLEILTGVTNSTGQITLAFEITSDIDHIAIEAEYEGSSILGQAKHEFGEFIYSILPPGISLPLLILIIIGAVMLIAIISVIIYKVTKPKPFEELMEKITEEEINLKYSLLSPGVILSIFDQRKGPIPLLWDHSLELPVYKSRMPIEIDNFLLKISDQAYSSLGFEEHGDERRTGTMRLSKERMVGFIHGITLENKQARGGVENLTLVSLTNVENADLLLNYQEFLYPEIDSLINALEKKKHVSEINKNISEIRNKSVIIMLAAQKIEEE
jgi:hypothetical protein